MRLMMMNSFQVLNCVEALKLIASDAVDLAPNS